LLRPRQLRSSACSSELAPVPRSTAWVEQQTPRVQGSSDRFDRAFFFRFFRSVRSGSKPAFILQKRDAYATAPGAPGQASTASAGTRVNVATQHLCNTGRARGSEQAIMPTQTREVSPGSHPRQVKTADGELLQVPS